MDLEVMCNEFKLESVAFRRYAGGGWVCNVDTANCYGDGTGNSFLTAFFNALGRLKENQQPRMAKTLGNLPELS